MADFEYRQAQEIRDAFARHGVRYLFLGKSGAILLGFPDTTQVVELFSMKSSENGRAMVDALREMGFTLTEAETDEVVRGKDFVQLRNVHSTSISSLRQTVSRISKLHGNATSMSRAFPYATRMTSSRAKKRPTARKIENRCLA
jgi:hypothetical protein